MVSNTAGIKDGSIQISWKWAVYLVELVHHIASKSPIGFQKISHDVKIATIWLYEHNLLIYSCCHGFSEYNSYHILKLWWETGNCYQPRQESLWLASDSRPWQHAVSSLTCLSEPWLLPWWASLPHKDQLLCINALCYYIHHELERAGSSWKELKQIAKEHMRFDTPINFIQWVTQYQPEEKHI